MANQLLQDILSTLEDADGVHELLDAITASNLKSSANLCVETIINTRKKIAEDGPREFWLEDIDDCTQSYRHLAHCYNYYTGKDLPTIEQALNDCSQK